MVPRSTSQSRETQYPVNGPLKDLEDPYGVLWLVVRKWAMSCSWFPLTRTAKVKPVPAKQRLLGLPALLLGEPLQQPAAPHRARGPRDRHREPWSERIGSGTNNLWNAAGRWV